ncbi:F-box protein CPR1-like [Corylus avellana]|uniref:F-box protein CPR1-like n=1 Tax=Corylus avellana TaxID=13451 RepID=UPI00286ADBCC|nr:F-box protein CPR1-like isoform X2 [Corylus avellana]XP_059450702.1 F-box protein CPR1-like [Corylus avellana]
MLWGRDLPEDLSMEILSRLPVKSLMRCKCISKSWYALITNPSFITMHLTSHNPNRRAAILRRGGGLEHLRLSTLSNETLEVSGNVDLSQLFLDEVSKVSIFGPCNGILCFSGTLWKNRDGHCDYGRLVLWNPATRESKLLPPFPRQSDLYFFSNLGFGFDPKTNDYKVVRIMNFRFRHCKVQKFGKGDLRANKEFETPKGLGSSSKGLGDIPIRSKVQISSGASNFLGPVHWRNVSIIRFL